MTEEDLALSVTVTPEDEEIGTEDDIAAEIQDTDIVFDCPHCGHNLAIDYRGAGLQINCVNCGEAVLVPIPDGMNIDDLDIEPGEILKQLFATRRNLHKAELRAEALKVQLAEQTERCGMMEAGLNAFKTQFEELKTLCTQQKTVQSRISAIVTRILEGDKDDAAASAEVEAEEAESDARG